MCVCARTPHVLHSSHLTKSNPRPAAAALNICQLLVPLASTAVPEASRRSMDRSYGIWCCCRMALFALRAALVSMTRTCKSSTQACDSNVSVRVADGRVQVTTKPAEVCVASLLPSSRFLKVQGIAEWCARSLLLQLYHALLSRAVFESTKAGHAEDSGKGQCQVAEDV